MAVLLDTNVISEMARLQPNSSVVDYLSHLDKAYLSAVTIHELHHGMELSLIHI